MSFFDSEDDNEAVKRDSSRERGKRRSSKTSSPGNMSSSSRSRGKKKSPSSGKRSSSKASASDRRTTTREIKSSGGEDITPKRQERKKSALTHKKKMKPKASSREVSREKDKNSRHSAEASLKSPTSSKRAGTKKKKASERSLSPSKRAKKRSPSKMRKNVMSPASASTTTITSPESGVSSLGTVVTSKSTRRRDRETSSKLKNLSMTNDKLVEVENTSPKSPPKIVIKKSNEMEIDQDINYLNANWVHSSHLLTLKELKQKNLKSEDKEKFQKRSLKEQIREVVYEHGPSELKMVYVQNCAMLGIPASVDFFKNGSKDKERFFEFIWEHRKSLRSIQNRYDYRLLKCLFDLPIYILKYFSIACHSDYNQT